MFDSPFNYYDSQRLIVGFLALLPSSVKEVEYS